MKPNLNLLVSICVITLLFLTISVISMITKSEVVEIIYGQGSPFIPIAPQESIFSNLNYKHFMLGSNIPLAKLAREYLVDKDTLVQHAKKTITIDTTYHDNFDSNITNPTVIKWYKKEIVDTTKPLIILVTVQGFLAPCLSMVIDELQGIITNDPDNEYIIVNAERAFLMNNTKIKQIEEIKFFDEAVFLYQLIDIVNEKYPNSVLFIYAYSLGASTIFDYLNKYDNSQGVKLAILNSPLLDISKFFNSTRYSVRLFNKASVAKFVNVIVQYKHLFKTDDEIQLYNKLMTLQSVKELVAEWIKHWDRETSSIHDIKDSTVPILAMVSTNDPILKYTKQSLETHCSEFQNLTCVIFQSGEHNSFKDKDNVRMAPGIIHKATALMLNHIRNKEHNITKNIVREMNADGILDVDQINEIVDTPDP
jgi:predicted alpha/beta-fold hydrolase